MFTTNTVFTATVLQTTCVTLSFTFSNDKKVNYITELKPVNHSEMKNVRNSTYVD